MPVLHSVVVFVLSVPHGRALPPGILRTAGPSGSPSQPDKLPSSAPGLALPGSSPGPCVSHHGSSPFSTFTSWVSPRLRPAASAGATLLASGCAFGLVALGRTIRPPRLLLIPRACPPARFVFSIFATTTGSSRRHGIRLSHPSLLVWDTRISSIPADSRGCNFVGRQPHPALYRSEPLAPGYLPGHPLHLYGLR